MTDKQLALVQQYRLNPIGPVGIRNEVLLRNVCLNCLSSDYVICTTSKGHPRDFKCNNCGVEWYVNHCWSCTAHGNVDERDPETPPCPVCGWLKCAYPQCRACDWNGCSTNRFSKDLRYIDTQSELGNILADIHRSERQDELRRRAAEYGFSLNSEDISYDEDMEMFFDGDHWYPAW